MYHAVIMAKIDREKERERLRQLYQGMSNGELGKIGADPASLTDVARNAFNAEMAARGMQPLPEPASAADQAERQAREKKAQEALEPVMIRRYRDLPEAAVAKSVLDSAGIESLLADDNLVRLDWFISNLLGGVKLLVRKEDAEAAVNLLEQAMPEKFDVEGVGSYEQPHCPQCGSMDVSFDGLNRPASYASLLIKVPIPIIDRGWKCHSCGRAWEDDTSVSPTSSAG
jgi:hypothetical protein